MSSRGALFFVCVVIDPAAPTFLDIKPCLLYSPGAATTGGKFLELAASEAAEKMVPIYRSQRVPGARALAPFLQALTASQQMKVSHEVCRAMTAGVKVRERALGYHGGIG